MVQAAGPYLQTLPSGETNRPQPYASILNRLVAQGMLEIEHAGEWPSMEGRTYTATPRHRPDAHTMQLGYLEETQEAFPVYRRLRHDNILNRLSYQASVPTDFTLSFAALGPQGPLQNKRAFTQATLRDIQAIHELTGDKALIQLEAAAELTLLAKAQPFQVMIERALRLGKGIASLARQSPEGARFGVHLCLGDLHNKADAQPHTTAPLVTLANALARHWPQGRTLEYIHGPLAAGDIPPSTNEAFYEDLGKLALGPHTAFYAGFVHEAPTLGQQQTTKRIIEQALGHPLAGVSTACGLGRRTRAVANVLMERAVLLAETATP